jgi:hypothetical protein
MSNVWFRPYLYVGGVGAGNYYEFWDRMLGFSFEKSVIPSELTTWTLNITLDNDDGAFTPRTTGTYANLNWFNQLVSISTQFNTPTGGTKLFDTSPFSAWASQYFLGIVDGFDIVDDGVNSRVELTCVDFLTIAARAPSVGSLTNSANEYQLSQINEAIGTLTTDYFSGTTALPVPPGFPSNKVNVGFINMSVGFNPLNEGTEVDLTDVDSTGNVADVLNASVLPSQYCVLIPAWIDRTTPGVTSTDYAVDYIGPYGIKSTDAAGRPIGPLYEFVEGSATGDEIPFVEIDIGFQLDKMVNSAQLTNVTTSTDVSAVNTASVIANGGRNASYTAIICKTTAEAQKQADLLVNRFSTPRYFPRSITINRAAVEATGLSTTREAIKNLLSLRGLWSRCTVTYTPTGHSTPITDYCVVSGIRVDATPGDMTVIVDLVPGVDYQSFVLDSTTLGVLDTNKLG